MKARAGPSTLNVMNENRSEPGSKMKAKFKTGWSKRRKILFKGSCRVDKKKSEVMRAKTIFFF